MTNSACDFNSEKFLELGELVKEGGIYTQRTGDDAAYQQFIEKYPAASLSELTLDQYCLGKNAMEENFCWWLERGIQNAIVTCREHQGGIFSIRTDAVAFIGTDALKVSVMKRLCVIH